MTAKKKQNLTLAQVKDELRWVAHVGEVFMDGDLCRKAWNPHAQTFMKGDDMDYNPEAGVPLKKTLLRLERVGSFPCCTSLWRQRPDVPESGEALLYGSWRSPYSEGKPSNNGYTPPKMTPEMEKVFKQGKTSVSVNRGLSCIHTLESRGLKVHVSGIKEPSTVQVFVPVKDSMGDIAAALEVFTLAMPD